ncbi:MAG TPA: hypothetical protein PLW11_01150 [Bacillota bacterium]|nr:hypothetical protein [Bacillota bacterium]
MKRIFAAVLENDAVALKWMKPLVKHCKNTAGLSRNGMQKIVATDTLSYMKQA